MSNSVFQSSHFGSCRQCSPRRATRAGLVLIATFLFMGVAVRPASAQNKRFIEVQVAPGSRNVLGEQQRWMEALSKIGADRIRSSSRVGPPAIKETSLGGGVTVRVTGALDGDKIKLPGRTFSIRDIDGMKAFVQQLRDDGATVALAEKKAFGLTSEQLVKVHDALSSPIELKTKGESAAKLLPKLLSAQPYKVVMGRDAARALVGGAAFTEELKGFSLGTGVAAAIRPLGLVLTIQRPPGSGVELHIVDSRKAAENWPIGWPTEDAVSEVEPKLMEKLKLEIKDVPLKSVLDAIEQRVGVPFLYDQNSLAEHGIELTEVKATLMRGKVAYMVALRKLLSQTRPQLVKELRLDEAGKPFLWISRPGK